MSAHVYWQPETSDGWVHSNCTGCIWRCIVPFSAFRVGSRVVSDFYQFNIWYELIKSCDIIPISLGCGTIWQILNPPPFQDPLYISNEDLILNKCSTYSSFRIRFWWLKEFKSKVKFMVIAGQIVVGCVCPFWGKTLCQRCVDS